MEDELIGSVEESSKPKKKIPIIRGAIASIIRWATFGMVVSKLVGIIDLSWWKVFGLYAAMLFYNMNVMAWFVIKALNKEKKKGKQ